ncbi:Short-chain dehydrogenase reductase sdr protein [Neofusicoccum parvum]|uniref:Short-chain dehydrogenase reductase sdr protein n=1 Tax=Neofusicoccum parvum TaxID=310453 RepID=A0ACB5SQM3_9PEZI|nr:Short-chain dehydrogenase reductase sdr protein [Neofusicoccum parvum]
MASDMRASERLRKKPRISQAIRIAHTVHPLTLDTQARNHKNKLQTTKHNIFNWAELPGELKNRVYDYVLTTRKTIRIRKSESASDVPTLRRHIDANDKKSRQLTSNLLLVNKKTYNEGAPLLYQNRLSFKDSFALYLFLHRLNSKQKQWIHHITLEFMTGKGFIQPTFDLLIGTSNIKTMTIRDFSEKSPGFNIATRLYCAAYNWLEAVGKEKGDPYAALALIKISDNAAVPPGSWAISRFEIRGARRKVYQALREKLSAQK